MAKQRERNSDEYFKGIIRQLKAEIKNLRRELHHLQSYQDNFVLSELADVPMPVYNKCPSCQEGSVEQVSVANRNFQRCNSCNYRTKAIKDNG